MTDLPAQCRHPDPTRSRVVVVRLGALGDMVIATAFLRRLISAHGDDGAVTLLTTPSFVPLFANFPGLSVVAFPRRGFRARWQAIRFLRSGRFDRIYDLQSNHRSRVLVAASGIRERVGLWPLPPFTHHPDFGREAPCHIFDRTNAMLAAAGVAPADPVVWLPEPSDAASRVEGWLVEAGLVGRPLVLLHAGASRVHPEKRWPGFIGLVTSLLDNGYQPVCVGGPDDAAINQTLATQGGVDATGVFSLPELIALGRRARFAVTNDSGPMHVIAAAGIPVFALFGPTDWRRSHAMGQRERVIVAPAGDDGQRDLAALEVSAVVARLSEAGLLTV